MEIGRTTVKSVAPVWFANAIVCALYKVYIGHRTWTTRPNMLSELTEEQKALQPKIVDYWVNLVLHSGRRVEIDDVEDYINELYRKLGLNKPEILVFDSYMAAKIAAGSVYANGARAESQVSSRVSSQVWSQVSSQVRSQVESQVLSRVRSQVGSQVGSQVSSQVGSQVGSRVSSQVWSQVTSQVRSQVESQVWSQVRSQVWSQVESQVRSQVRSRVWAQVSSRVEAQVGSQVESQVSSQVSSQVWSQVTSQVRSQVESQVLPRVWSQVSSQVWSQVSSHVESQVSSQVSSRYVFVEQHEGLNDWAGFLAYYDYFERIGIVNHKPFGEWRDYLKSGIWSIDYFDGCVIISRLPTKVIRDQNGRLHSFTEPAVQWADGLNNHFIYGVGFPAEIWNSIVKKTISAKEAISLPDLAQRTIACQTIGYDSVLAELGAKLIDKETRTTPNGQNLNYQLLEINLNDDGQPAKFVKVECPSTGRETLLRVHPRIDTVRTAVAWTFGMRPDDYMPEIET
jgi:hypothetical protein